MARIEELEQKVLNAAEKVAKCKGTIERHKKQLAKMEADYEKKGNAVHPYDAYKIDHKRDDIKGAEKKLKDAERILEGWNEKLKVETEKERYLEGTAPQVIKDFLELWKQHAHEWHMRRYKGYDKFCAKLDKEEMDACVKFLETTPGYEEYLTKGGKVKAEYKTWSHMHNYVHPRKPLKDHLKSLHLDYASIKMRKMEYAGAVVLKMISYRNDAEALAYLERELEEEKKRKMLDLINRITAIVGTITDANALSVSPKGNLDGWVVGEEGTATVQTIGAGGYNIQCFHYRTLVHEVKPKKGGKKK